MSSKEDELLEKIEKRKVKKKVIEQSIQKKIKTEYHQDYTHEVISKFIKIKTSHARTIQSPTVYLKPLPMTKINNTNQQQQDNKTVISKNKTKEKTFANPVSL